jgi:hypothetical protein
MSHGVLEGLAVIVSVMGGSEKFLHGIGRYQKPLLTVPLHNNSYYTAPY